MCKISVIMPVYNAVAFLPISLDCVLAQTFDAFELICVDDCSTDASLEILQSYAQNDPRIKIVRQTANSGSGPTRNLGLENASGEYVIFWDPDDFYPANALEVLYTAAKESGADFSVGNLAIYDATLERCVGLGERKAALQIYTRCVCAPLELPALWTADAHVRFLIRRDFILEHGLRYPALLRGEDVPFTAKLLCVARKAATVPDVVYDYRIASSHKINTDEKVAGYLAHIGLTVDTFNAHGFTHQAALYVYYVALESAGLSFFRNYTRAQRRKILACFDALFKKYPQDWNFAPYNVNPVQVRAQFSALRKGLLCFLIFKFLEKFRRS